MEYKWEKTSPRVYRVIYEHHKDDFSVFESYTEMDSHGDKLKAQITAWGFSGAEHPIIKSELSYFNIWEYYILLTTVSEE